MCLDVLQSTIAPSVSSEGRIYNWNIPINQTPSDYYRVELKSISNPSFYSRSNNYFTISGIQVTTPNGGENWQAGPTHSIRWTQAGLTGTNVEINLRKQVCVPFHGNYLCYNALQYTIAPSVPINQNIYSWTIRSNQTSGNAYRIEVKSLSYPAFTDSTDGLFTITSLPSSITVTVPNGGETWQRGTPHTVMWSYTGSPGSYVKIVLLKGGTEIGTISANTSIGSGGAGSFTWNINPSGSTGSDYKVKISSISQPTINDLSNNNFTLTPVPTTPRITVTSPNGNETWQRGTPHKVTWSYTGIPGSMVKITLLKAGVEVGTINASTSIGSSGAGSYTWPISSSGTTGSDYKVKVQSISQPEYIRHKQ